jgi:hypothetical protein
MKFTSLSRLPELSQIKLHPFIQSILVSPSWGWSSMSSSCGLGFHSNYPKVSITFCHGSNQQPFSSISEYQKGVYGVLVSTYLPRRLWREKQNGWTEQRWRQTEWSWPALNTRLQRDKRTGGFCLQGVLHLHFFFTLSIYTILLGI